jgi:murein DD-endopeptidase MepM/ murein hydrolase activator NlpD
VPSRVEWLGQAQAGIRAFPVGAPSNFTREFGAAHRGTDIFSVENAPIVAIERGSIRSASDPLGGLVLYLRADSSWRYYYAHLSRYVGAFPRRVEVGELVGYMGSTGNAAGGPQHLHFEMTDPQGTFVDPYDYLLQAQQGTVRAGRGSFPWLAVAAAVALGVWYFRRG